jgi:hypothetical protein
MAFNDTTSVVLCCNTASGISQLCFFSDTPTSEDGQTPYQIAVLSPSTGGYITWEGEQLTGTFQPGPGIFAPGYLGFTTQITGNALAQPINTQVGTAYHAPLFIQPPPGQNPPPAEFNVFNVFRDNDRVVYTDPVLGAVDTLYYCVFVSCGLFYIPSFALIY